MARSPLALAARSQPPHLLSGSLGGGERRTIAFLSTKATSDRFRSPAPPLPASCSAGDPSRSTAIVIALIRNFFLILEIPSFFHEWIHAWYPRRSSVG